MKIVQRHLADGFNDRKITPVGIIIHYVSARYTAPDSPYDPDEIIAILREYGLGYHDLIARDGTVIELVPAPLRAWHAGVSEWHGRGDCNSWTLGIALAGMYDEPFTDAQYDALAQRTGQYVGRFPIRPENIAGHEHVAPDSVRGEGDGKSDPGPSFDWPRYRYDISGLWAPEHRAWPEFMR